MMTMPTREDLLTLPTDRAGRRPRRVLVTSPGPLGEQMAGPVIRAWAIARVLSARFDVTIAAPDPRESVRDGIRVVPFERYRLSREVPAHDALISPCVPPFVLGPARVRPTLVVSDQYDPADLEAAMLPSSFLARRRVKSQLASIDLQLRYADVVLHANERQGRRIHERIEQLGRDRAPQLVELPFGLADPPPPVRSRPLRGRFPQIGDRDTLVLWWGVAWNWLDADTAVRAVAQLASSRPEIKLVFATTRMSPTANPKQNIHNGSERARTTARELGVLDRTIFFWDDWISFDRRHEFLQEADIGLTLHGVTDEARFASRIRYLDYLWAGLPCVLAEGDQTGARFAQAGFATLVPPGDREAVRAALLAFADKPAALDRARSAGAALSAEYRWETLVDPLARVLAQTGAPANRSITPEQTLRVAKYYARRVVDTAVFAFDRA